MKTFKTKLISYISVKNQIDLEIKKFVHFQINRFWFFDMEKAEFDYCEDEKILTITCIKKSKTAILMIAPKQTSVYIISTDGFHYSIVKNHIELIREVFLMHGKEFMKGYQI